MCYSKYIFKRWVFRGVLKILIVAVVLLLFGSAFRVFVPDTVNHRAPTGFYNSSLLAKRISPRCGSYGLARFFCQQNL